MKVCYTDITTNRRRHRRSTRRNRGDRRTRTEHSQYIQRIDTLDDSFDYAAPIQIGRGRSKQPKDTKTNTPGEGNLKMHVENMNEDQLQQAIETLFEDANNITIVDNGNDGNYYKTKQK